MEERKINFSRNTDQTLVEDPDGKLEKDLKGIWTNLQNNVGFCYEQLKKKQLTVGMKEIHMSLIENYTIDFLKSIGYDSQLQKQKEERFSEIRSLNEENRELRKQLGDKVSNEDIREKIKNIEKEFKEWWNDYGFGHVSEFFITPYGIKANLSGMVFESHYKKELPYKNKTEYLKELGFEILDNDVISNDDNISKLTKLLKSKYQSIEINEIKSNSYQGRMRMHDIMINIYDLNDFK